MDIWESNSVASAYTLHPCNTVGQVVSHYNLGMSHFIQIMSSVCTKKFVQFQKIIVLNCYNSSLKSFLYNYLAIVVNQGFPNCQINYLLLWLASKYSVWQIVEDGLQILHKEINCLEMWRSWMWRQWYWRQVIVLFYTDFYSFF